MIRFILLSLLFVAPLGAQETPFGELKAPFSALKAPQRIVSMNLCTDQLLLLLVDKARIASLSYFATDPAYSWLAPQAQGIPGNRGQAEEVLAFEPDLILTSQFSATLAANLLERLGHPVQRLGFAATLDEVYTQIRQVAAWTDSTARAESLIGELQMAIAHEQQVLLPQLRGKSAVFFAANGFSYGANSLQDAFLASLGLRNVAAEAGLYGPAQLSLEVLLAAEPDFLVTDRRRALDAQLAYPLLQHPALAALSERTRVLELPDTLFQCAGPQLVDAYRTLSAQLAQAAQ
jgi:iron complex transport system substrate-binding protein